MSFRAAHRILVGAGVHHPREAETLLVPFLERKGPALRGKAVLDIGTGSGVLALFAAREGAARVVATDIDARAQRCAQRNVREAGLGAVIEVRRSGRETPEAFSAVGPDERFDVVLSNPPAELGHPVYRPEDTRRNDCVALALSTVKGLDAHLRPGGTAVLLYGSVTLFTLAARCGAHLGFDVQGVPPSYLPERDWRCLYDLYALQVSRKERLDPKAMLLGPETDRDGAESRAERGFQRRTARGRSAAFPGVLVLRKD